MADLAVERLRDAFANAPAGPVILNAAFWTAAGDTPPAGFDDAIKAAYRLPATSAGLQIQYDRANVTPVQNDSFSISGVSLSFLEAPGTPVTTLYGAAGTPQTPLLGIDVTPVGWQLSDQFPNMSSDNPPFNLLAFDQQRFYFASAAQPFAWTAQGVTLAMAAGQNLYGMIAVPALAVPLIQLIANLPQPPSQVPAVGPIVLDKANNTDILYTDMKLRAFLPGASGLKLFFLTVAAPYLGMTIETAMETADDNGALLKNEEGQAEARPVQTPFYFFGTEITVEGVEGTSLPFSLQAAVSNNAKLYRFAIGPSDEKTPITPAAVLGLMFGGGGSGYFGLAAAPLQQYLSSVQLQGFAVNGPLQPADWNSLSVIIGSVQNQPIPLFSDPTTKEVFQLDSFSLTWTLAKT